MSSFIVGHSLRSLLRPSTNGHRRKTPDSASRKGGSHGGIFKLFMIMPMLSSGCRMVRLLGRHNNRTLLADHMTMVTLFGHRHRRVNLSIHEDTRAPPVFLIDLPMVTSVLHREIASGVVKFALKSDTHSMRCRLVEEYVLAVFCDGCKAGYSIRWKDASADERYAMRLLRGVSMGAGMMLAAPEKEGDVPI